MTSSYGIVLLAVSILSGPLVPKTDATCTDDLRQKPPYLEVLVLEGTLAGVILANITNNGDLSDSNTHPLLKTQNGHIVTKQNVFLDGEENRELCDNSTRISTFEIWCQDSPRNPIVQIQISLLLTDDRPVEVNPLVAYVTEEQPAGTKVVKLQGWAKDDDCGATILYGVEGPSKPLFKIGSTTADFTLETTKPLDYELQKIHILNLTAASSIDSFQTLTYNWTTLTVIVEDIDDMSPVFDVSQFVLHVLEEQNLSHDWKTSAPPVLARDGDVGINTTLSYSLLEVQPPLNMTINNSTGQVKILDVVDREKVSSYTCVIRAAQTDLSYRTATATLVILVDDINDNRPVYTGPTQASVKEDALVGSRVLELTGTDRDEEQNGRFDFIITNDTTGGAFGVEASAQTNRSYLIVRTNTALRNYSEATLVIRLVELTPRAGGPVCDYASTCAGRVTVQIQNSNNHSPTFLAPNYVFTLAEDTQAPAIAGQVHATDPDIGDNALIKYKAEFLSGPSECTRLVLDPLTGTITLQRQITTGAAGSQLPSGLTPSYDLPAVLILSRPLPRGLTLLQQIPASLTLPEQPPSSSALPQDLSAGSNPSQSLLSVLAQSRSAASDSTGDHSRTRETVCQWMVTACDSPLASDSRCSSVPLTVKVVESSLKVLYTLEVSENVPVGTKLTTFWTNDFKIISPYFNLIGDALYTSAELDRETQEEHVLPVYSHSTNTSSFAIRVIIEDVNDNTPTFQQSLYSITIQNKTQILNQNVIKVHASDRDAGQNGQVRYYLPAKHDYFSIDSETGEIRLIKLPPVKQVELYILATDLGTPPLQDLARLQVTMLT